MKFSYILLFLAATKCIAALLQTDEKRQVKSYSSHLKPLPDGVKVTCLDLYKSGKKYNDIYLINPDGKGSFAVMCDISGGGWTLFQHRFDGFLDFYRDWKDYKEGFGTLLGDFWLGLKLIHRITASRKCKLRIELEDFKGGKRFAEYSSFQVGSESDGYKLNIGAYSGNAGDSLSYHNGAKFTTKDADHDNVYWLNCAQRFHGAWWYNACHYSNLNGFYYRGGKHASYADGINWYHWKGYYYSMKTVTMKLKEI